MRVLVTGGSGFIGANLCRRLLADGAEVTVIDDLSTGVPSNIADLTVRLLEASILDNDALNAAVDGQDAIVHLAARPSVPRSVADPEASHEVNATGTLRVLEAARRTGAHVVMASSSSVYGHNESLPKHEGLVPMPASPYAASKLAAEAYAESYSTCFGLSVLAFRFFNVFGPLQHAGHAYAAVIPQFVEAALSGGVVSVHGDGLQTRDFTFVDTVTAVLSEAVARRVSAPRAVNLAFGSRCDLLDILGLLEDVVGHPIERRHTAPRTGDVRDSQADCSRLRELFPLARPTPLEVGLQRTVDWMRENPTSRVSRDRGLVGVGDPVRGPEMGP